MAYSHEITLQVPFHDLDPMRIVWHGHYFKYFDRARLALFDNAGIDLYQYMTHRQIAFPITRTQTKHIAPLLPRDQFVCKATVTEARFKIAMEFEIRRLPNRQLCVQGKSEQLAVKFPDMELEFEIPPDIQKALATPDA